MIKYLEKIDVFWNFDLEGILEGFWEGFGRVWGWIFDDFSHFFQNSDFTEKSTKHCVGAWILKVGSYKNMWNSGKIGAKIKEIIEFKKTSQKLTQKSDLGGSWASFGRGLGRSGGSLGRSWVTFVRILDVQNTAFFKHGSKMGSKRPFGSSLGGSWEDLGKIWARFGQKSGSIWTFFWPVVGKFWKHLEKCSPAGAKLLNWTPALIREASQCAGVPPQREESRTKVLTLKFVIWN